MNTILPRIALLSAILVVGAPICFAGEPFPGPQAQFQNQLAQVRLEKYNAILRLISERLDQRAADECRALIESDPEFSRPYGKLVFIAGRSGQLAPVERYFETLSQTNPRAFYSLGLIRGERKEYQAAVESQIKCLTAVPDFLPAVEALVRAAHELKKYDDVERFFLSRPTEAAFALGLGYLDRLRERHDLAMDRIEQALRLNPSFFEALKEKSAIYLLTGRNADALSLCEELLPAAGEGADPERRFHLLDLKTKMSYDLGQTAMDLIEMLRLAREYGLKISEEAVLSQVGTAYWRMNSFSKALGYYQRALEMSRASGSRNLSNRLGNIGLVYSSLGDPSKAAEFYQQAIAAARAATPPQKSSLINFLINLGILNAELGRLEEGRPMLEEATRILGSSRTASLTYRLQSGWALYHAHGGNFRESLAFNQAALQIARESRDALKQSASLYRIGDAQLRLMERAAAIASYEAALAIGRQIQALSIIWKAEAGLAQCWRHQQPERALQHYRRAIEAIEDIRSRQASPEERSSLFQNKTGVYESAVRLLVSLHRRDPSKQYDAEAFQLSERARARALLDSLGETVTRLEQNMDKTLRDRQREIQQRLSHVEAQIVKAAGDERTPSDARQKLEADLLRAVNEYLDWRQQVRARNPRIGDLTLPEPFTIEQVQESLRSDG
jgi:tetratricopeptide (TPR) repeat protein